MKRRVAIIGTGWVGASVAISTLHSGIADELLLNDQRGDVAEGEAMDLAHGASLYASATVRTASIEEMVEADAVVVSAGRGGRPNESRLDLLRDNASMTGPAGIVRQNRVSPTMCVAPRTRSSNGRGRRTMPSAL